MSSKVSKEQILYANILNAGMLVGLASLILIFFLYATGILDSLIPLEKVQEYWVLSVHKYLEQSGIQTGWAWLGNLEYGDMLSLLPIAFLSLLTVVCYIVMLPGLIAKKDTAYLVIAILEILILLLAASGILATGGH
ncbi:MAG: hypothetical protein WBQ32_07325 [Ignavibacteriaceae bacterium]